MKMWNNLEQIFYSTFFGKMKTITINNVEVEFQVIENEIFANSLQIAKVFEKEHDEVVAEIDEMSCDFEIHDGTCHIDELYSKSVKWSTYIDENGQEQKMCLLSKDGFVFLFIRFDVTYAIEQEWGLRYIKAYNAAKDELIRTNTQKGKA